MSVLRSLEKPFIVNFEITSQCDQHCDFCSAQLATFRRQDLPTDSVLKIVSTVAEEGIRSIFLTGGEPLLRDDLPLIIRHCGEYRMNVSLSTNGMRATEATSRALAEAGLDEIQVSIQAPNEIHDEMVGVKGALERTLNGLRNLADAGLRVTVAAVATRRNYLMLPELAEMVSAMGAKHFRVLRLMTHSAAMLEDMVPCDELRLLVERLATLEETLDGVTIMVHAPPGYSDDRSHNPNEYSILHPLSHTCTAGKLSMGILSDGECVPCLEFKNAEFMCGNILERPLVDIWNSAAMRALRLSTPDNYRGRCGSCESRWVCYSARCVAYNLQGDILGTDESCYRV